MKIRALIVFLILSLFLTGCTRPKVPIPEAEPAQTEEADTNDENGDEFLDEEEIVDESDPNAIIGGRGMWTYSRTHDKDGNLVYKFKDLVLTLPAFWEGEYETVYDMEGEYISFYHADTLHRWQTEYGDVHGRLLTVGYSRDDSYQTLQSYRDIGPGPEEGFFYFDFPTTLQTFYEDDDLTEAYNEMVKGVDFVIAHTYSTIEE